MKKHILTLIAVVAMVGCTKEDRLPKWVKSAAKPIIIKTNIHYHSVDRDLTLIAKDGSIFFVKNTTIILPDTIN